MEYTKHIDRASANGKSHRRNHHVEHRAMAALTLEERGAYITINDGLFNAGHPPVRLDQQELLERRLGVPHAAKLVQALIACGLILAVDGHLLTLSQIGVMQKAHRKSALAAA